MLKIGLNMFSDFKILGQYPTLQNAFGMVWRFAPMVDPLVSEFHSRDLDSVPSLREADAVKEWLTAKNKTFHIMRDHPLHGVPILGDIINTYYFFPSHIIYD